MRRVGQTRRRDQNETRILVALETVGVQCFRVSAAGLPDLLTYRQGVWLPIEIKHPRGHLTPAQVKTRATAWFPVVTSAQEALALYGVRADD